MKIGLIFPNKDRRYKTIHLGLAYIAAYARTQHKDIDFLLLDTRTSTYAEKKAFFDTSFDLIGITVFSPVYDEVKSIFKTIKNLHPSTPVCLGGPYVTTIMDEIFIDTPAEYGIYGEGEISFSELIFALKGKRNINNIKGLIYKDASSRYVTNPQRPQISDLDELPWPAYDLYKMERYPLHRILNSRGCPYSCVFCNSSSIWGNHWRSRSPQKVFEEITFLINTYGRKTFAFNDNTLNIDKDALEKLCDLLIENNTNIMWTSPVRADNITPDLAYKMKLSGCYNVTLGIESANNEILQKMRKNTSIEKTKAGIVCLKEAGIEVLGQFVIGSPFETLKDVRESIMFAQNSLLDYVNFYTILPYKGTSQWAYVKKNGRFYSETIHDYHKMNPRIVFETIEFPYNDRIEAVKLVEKAGFYSNKDKRSLFFDLTKSLTYVFQKYLPASLSKRLYMVLKSIYKRKIIKRNNF